MSILWAEVTETAMGMGMLINTVMHMAVEMVGAQRTAVLAMLNLARMPVESLLTKISVSITTQVVVVDTEVTALVSTGVLSPSIGVVHEKSGSR